MTEDVDDETFEQMKRWLGTGEIDIDLAIRFGVTSRANIITVCRTLVDSPWFPKQREQHHENQTV